MTVTIVTNNHSRELLAGYQIPEAVWNEEFGYLGEYAESNEETMATRFFRYQGSWYDVNEFTRLEHDGELAKAGFAFFQSDTYFSGIAFRWGKCWDGTVDYDSAVIARVAFLD